MKVLGYVVLCLSILGCNHSNNESSSEPESIRNMEIDGLWLMSSEQQTYKESTGEYLSSSFISRTYIFEETERGVKFDKCIDYGGLSSYGIKTDEHFYLYANENGFYLNVDNILEQQTEYSYELQPEFTYKSIVHLTKMSDVQTIDSGTLIINGAVTLEQYSHLCIWEVSYSHGYGRVFELLSPFGDDDLSFRLEINDVISPGVYQYDKNANDNLVEISITSFATEFRDDTGTSWLYPKTATIEFIEYNDVKISGIYSFVDENDVAYSGEFEFFLNR